MSSAGATSPPDGTPLLSLDGITRRFGSVVALDNASFSVRPGTVHALLGENGAGKTTLMRVAFGLLAPDAGVVRVRGVAHAITSPAKAHALGLGMVHQHFTLVPAMTVAENVALGSSGRFDPRAAAQRVYDVGERAGLGINPAALVSSLSIGAQQRCEIVKALARDVEVLILDEPTAVLAPSEAAELLAWVRRFADSGRAVVLITHKLRDALSVADEVTVLRRGRTVLVAAVGDTSQDALRAAMVGDVVNDADGAEIAREVVNEAVAPNETVRAHRDGAIAMVLGAEGVSYADARGAMRVRNASLEVRAGEIVGVAAVEGAGQHELLRLLAGRLKPQRGSVTRPAALGFVPEDRHRDALMLDAPLDENIALRGAGARHGLMPWRAIREETRALIATHDVRASGPRAIARTLSGGNQQKLVLARELADSPEALVVENPSRGLDFHATAAVHRALRTARDSGAAVVMYSSDLDEVLMLADRVYVMFGGQLAEVPREREAVGRAMLGGV
ncbi:MAG TPA: ABC transporter ATP-binding protein [Casimicrobiaceae bacterium]|nr:ABC transporter ATP-binding protein [Casimicrobiaceae bacterium]